MGYVISSGKVGEREVPELSRAVPTVRCSANANATAADHIRGMEMDDDKLEGDTNRGIRITILNLDRLGAVARNIAESETTSRIRRWGLITLATWAIAATIICAMQWATIVELQRITEAIGTKAVHGEATQ